MTMGAERTSRAAAETTSVANGARDELPAIGLGTWPALGSEAVRMVASAAAMGYPLIDTAQNYDNEAAVGEGLRRSGVNRDEFWVASKLRGKYQGRKTTLQAVEESLLRMRLEHFDLYMVHWPNPSKGLYVDTWHDLVGARERGLVRRIGVCNFTVPMLDEITEATGVAPYVNQIQLNPFWSRATERAAHVERGIRTEAYSPLGRGGELLTDPLLTGLSEKYGTPIGTLVLAWAISRGATPLPKSASPERQRSNLAALELRVESEDLLAIDSLDGSHPESPLSDPLVYEQF